MFNHKPHIAAAYREGQNKGIFFLNFNDDHFFPEKNC